MAKSTDMAMHSLPTRTEKLGQGGEYIVNTPVPHADLLQSCSVFVVSLKSAG